MCGVWGVLHIYINLDTGPFVPQFILSKHSAQNHFQHPTLIFHCLGLEMFIFMIGHLERVQ